MNALSVCIGSYGKRTLFTLCSFFGDLTLFPETGKNQGDLIGLALFSHGVDTSAATLKQGTGCSFIALPRTGCNG